MIFEIRNATIANAFLSDVSPLESDHNFFVQKLYLISPLEENTVMPITRSVRQLTIEAVVNPWADRQRRCEWPSGLKMATLLNWLVNTANSSMTIAEFKTKHATDIESGRVVHAQWTAIFVHYDYCAFRTEDVYSLGPDEWVIATSESSSWLSRPSTFGFNGGANSIGVGHSFREEVELKRKNTIAFTRVRDADHQRGFRGKFVIGLLEKPAQVLA